MQYTFQTSRYQVSALLPEVSAALEKRMEAEGRKRLPGLWKIIDRQLGGIFRLSAGTSGEALTRLDILSLAC